MSILEGEGLFNDVTAIVLYHVAVAAAVSGSFSPGQAVFDLVLSAVVAVAVGLALGWGANKLMDLLGDATLQIGLTLLVPYASYVLAEELHGSGVLAVLTTALFLAEYATDADDVMTRLAGHTFWDIVDTLVTGVAFGLIGLELHNAIRTASGRWGEMLGWAAAIVGVVVVLVRLLWLLPATWLTKRLHAKRDIDEEIPMAWRETVVMWWSGMRGVASVALALAIPLETDDGVGVPRPGRDRVHRVRGDHGDARAAGADAAVAGEAAGGAGRHRAGEGVREGPRRPGGEGGQAAAAGDRGAWRSCRRSCPSRCCGGRSRSGCGSVPRWGTRSGARPGAAAQADAADPGGDAERGAARGAGGAERAGGRSRRSWTGCCGIWTCAVCGDVAATIV